MADTGADSRAFQDGEKVRRAVLGDGYVDKALQKGQSEYTRPLQKFITEYAWGTVWTRPELERKQRSIINLAFLIALKSWPELRLHTKGAIRNGLSIVEIREVVLQSMVYCGVPAGVEAMKQTEAAINEMIAEGECRPME
ncbi:uncharacterized protein PV07_05937 [Cladophialophora immunda]|uniref:Carboxymuconolactone decarboxylase-like domain-containing protein n=1 Tax=Cladophialophora immunda TaxID=569365 RepID=A0A0D2CJ91_9EURO|nr:uncharacterized protein PV07_05937 [Cladophialophora immunda]KIW30175.1 hypothetical protein PV07_05937 [Cladophialophora immunda]OQU95876.1 hypothetical protein CLAIMM_02040 [Cladophialophora immunda]